MPIGAEVQSEGGTHFRVWAPRAKRVEVVVGQNREISSALKAEADGYFSGTVRQAKAGDVYAYKLDDRGPFYDPASRFQPDGPHGVSRVVDPNQFKWTDQDWRGRPLKGQVIYEMHIGTFTAEGNWAAAIKQLPALADTGITVLEVMPIADFTGKFGWGYDGVCMFAPTRLYGEPDDFRRFVNEAHRLKMSVILDVVYNHFGPDGNYLHEFSETYFTKKYDNEWGSAINFDDAGSAPVREFFLSNAGYWMDEYHLDGLRLDATQQIFDASDRHILTEIGERVRAAAKGRETILVTENECQHAKLVRPIERGGNGLDGLWNDDFHHSARVALAGRNEAYYTDYLGAPQEFISAAKWGYLYQGQWYKWQNNRRGQPALDLRPEQFITYLDNHDQVANSGTGKRIHQLASPARYRAITALMLLGPSTPMLFQGQEFAASNHFYYFADHKPELAKLVREGRGKFMKQFRSFQSAEMQAALADPADPKTFSSCKLDHGQREKHADIYNLHRDLLRLRREDKVFSAQTPRGVDGAVLGATAFVLRFFGEDGDDRLLIVNLGCDLHLNPAPEPLLAPPADMQWVTQWSSEDIRYGGNGTPPLDTDENWRLPGEAAVALRPAPRLVVTKPGQSC